MNLFDQRTMFASSRLLHAGPDKTTCRRRRLDFFEKNSYRVGQRIELIAHMSSCAVANLLALLTFSIVAAAGDTGLGSTVMGSIRIPSTLNSHSSIPIIFSN